MNRLILVCLIPFGSIFSFSKIGKLGIGILLSLSVIPLGILMKHLWDSPYHSVVAWGMAVAYLMFFVRKWSIEWNNKIDSQPSTDS